MIKMKSLKRIFTIPFKYAPLEALWIMFQKLLAGILPTIEVIITALFIDTAINIFNGVSEMKSIVLPILFILVITAYRWLSEQLSRIAQIKLESKLRENFRCKMVEKTASLKYIYIEEQETLDLISRVLNQIETKCNDAYASTLDMFAMGIKVFGLLCLLFTKVWWCSVIILVISIPLFLVALKGGQATYEAEKTVQKYYRRVDYLENVLNGRESVEERSIFNYSKSVNRMWTHFYELARKVVFKANLEWYLKSKAGSVITAILSMIIVVILIFPLRQGLITMGMFISITNSVFSLINLLSWSLPSYADALSKNMEYMIDLDDFLKLENEDDALEQPSQNPIILKSLEFKNVSFKYPRTSNYILKNISFKIEQGKHYALVGTNGAGKTTIIKLITGLYKDYEGEILINDINLKNYTIKEIKSLTSIVYQDFAKYNLSLKENIALGDINNIDDINQVKDAVDYMELTDEVEKLENGLDSNLGKIKEDGIDLSGGQWQRIAIARSFVSKAPLRILDEPTAALDPISENEIYNNFERISTGKTVIFISHRLASTKLADKIFVLDKGQIAEEGSFDELIKNKGIYSKMYESQRSWYV